MDRRGIEEELRVMTKKELLALASDAGIVNRHRMTKGSLVEALVPSRIYQSLSEAPNLIRDLGRKDLIQLCELAGKKVRRNSRKADLMHELEEQISSVQRDGGVENVVAFGIDPEGVEQSFPREEAVSEPLTEVSGLPRSYSETRVVLLPVHPYLVHVYWEIANRDLEKARSRFGRERSRIQPVLRFFDVSTILPDSSANREFFDVKIELEAGQWYVDLWSPHRSYYVELGLRGMRGRFLPLCRSKVAETPPAWPSTEEDERYVRVSHGGESIKIEVVEERRSHGSSAVVAERLRVGGGSEPGWIFESRPGNEQIGIAQNEPEGVEAPRGAQEDEKPSAGRRASHFPGSVAPTPRTSRPDITDLCEKIADIGMSSGSMRCAREDDG